MSIEKITNEKDGGWHPWKAGRWFGVETICGHTVCGEWVERRWNPDGGPLVGLDQYGGLPSGEWEYRLTDSQRLRLGRPTPEGAAIGEGGRDG